MASITITIPDEKLDDFKEGSLRKQPVPRDDAGSKLYTDNQWIKQWGISNYKDAYRIGKELIAKETTPPEIDDDIISWVFCYKKTNNKYN